MASEAVVSFVVGKLGDLLVQELQLLYEVHEQFKWIETELESMLCFLKDAEFKRKGDASVKNWVGQIRDIAYDAEDVIDTFILSQTIQRRRRGFEQCVKKHVCIINELRSRHKVAKQIERIKLKIGDVSRRKETYDITKGINEERQEASSSTPSLQELRGFSALFEETDIVGLQSEINSLEKQLMKGEPSLSVTAIVGMGGLGKTTLAKKVYHNVKMNFDCHAFIYLSQQYEIRDVILRIMKCVMSLSQVEIDYLDRWELGKKLSEHLKEKRYLVVIDDIWSKEPWDVLKLLLPDGKNKSRILLTTRKKDVALHAWQSNLDDNKASEVEKSDDNKELEVEMSDLDDNKAREVKSDDNKEREVQKSDDNEEWEVEMSNLDDNKGWELFSKKISQRGNCPSALEDKKGKILSKCGGLPLAIIALGGLFGGKSKSLSEWSEFLESEIGHLKESFERCTEILALSYWDLPHYLKPCFLYFGLFPKDYEIHAGRLIRLWIAEGFIQQRENEIEQEGIAEKYLEELVDRNMIQVASKRSNGTIRTCRIHDFFHDFSIYVAKQNNFFTIFRGKCIGSFSTGKRRLALHHKIERYEQVKHSTSTVRSILCFPDSAVFLLELLKVSGKLLRVVDANWAGFAHVDLTQEIGDFVHLRYLELRHSRITKCLPSSIGDLSKLQTLRLSYSGTLPSTISNLDQLRHLKVDGKLIDGQPELNTLTNLRTLGLRAGSWIGDGLEKLTNLKKLGISGDLSKNHNALPNSIKKLCSLQVLKLRRGSSIPLFMSFASHSHLYKMHLDGRIEKLPELPPNLAELTLRDSELEQDAISTLEKLQNLKILRLDCRSYVSQKMTCSSKRFSRLELLVLNELSLEEWIVEEGAMPSIKSIELFNMTCLKTLSLPKQVHVLLKQY